MSRVQMLERLPAKYWGVVREAGAWVEARGALGWRYEGWRGPAGPSGGVMAGLDGLRGVLNKLWSIEPVSTPGRIGILPFGGGLIASR